MPELVLELLFGFGILGALELSSLFESEQTECGHLTPVEVNCF